MACTATPAPLTPIVTVNDAIRRNGRTHALLTRDLHPKRNPLTMEPTTRDA